MKPRIEKKLSKKSLAIFSSSHRPDFQQTAKRAWIDDEFELPWLTKEEKAKSPAKERLHRHGRVRVNRVPSIGGEYDSYAGEGTDFHSLYKEAREYVHATSIDWHDYEFGYNYPESNIKGRLTGNKVLERLRKQAESEH